MTPIQTLYTYLFEAGVIAEWEDPNGETQPAPTVQMRLLEEEDAPNDERILLIKQASAGGGSRFATSPVFTFAVLGKVGESAAYAESYADLIYEALLKFDNDNTIIGIDPIGAVNGAYKMASGRCAYDTEWVVKVENGIV